MAVTKVVEKEKEVTITFRIQRYMPEKDEKPYFKEYKIPITRGMTILDAIAYIQERVDNTLSFRASCRMGICGSCGLLVNGIPRLACQTQVLQLNTTVVELRPLPNFPIVKDLIVDFTGFFEKHRSIKPYIIRPDVSDLSDLDKEYIQSPEEHLMYLQFSYCIKCGLCYSACPTTYTDELFLGPQALTQAYRYSADTRDNGIEERLLIVDNPHGCWRCHFAGACTMVCPRGVDPALAIQLLKKEIAARRFGAKPRRELAKLAPPPKEAKPRPNIPKPPPPSV